MKIPLQISEKKLVQRVGSISNDIQFPKRVRGSRIHVRSKCLDCNECVQYKIIRCLHTIKRCKLSYKEVQNFKIKPTVPFEIPGTREFFELVR